MDAAGKKNGPRMSKKKKRLGTTGMGVKRCQRTKQKCEEFDLSECGGLLLEE